MAPSGVPFITAAWISCPPINCSNINSLYVLNNCFVNLKIDHNFEIFLHQD